MDSQNTSHPLLVELVVDALQEDITAADRLTAVVTRAVPWQLPGRLLWTLNTLAPAPVDRERIEHAIVSVEFICLHQYLHTIPRTGDALVSPAVDSLYAESSILSILDGDSLQACAFSRLTDVTDDRETVERYYDLVSTRSITCYEQSITEHQDTPVMALSPIAGVAARIGAQLGGMSKSQAEAIEQAAAALGRAVPVRTPSGWRRPTVTNTDVAVDNLVDAVDDAPEATQRLKTLVRTEQQLMQ